jgi:16S rRNA processing protein RimM
MDLIAIGRISKPIGTRGEVRILPFTDDKQRFSDLQFVWMGENEEVVEQREIRTVRIDAKHVVLSIRGVETVEKAEEFRDQYLFVPKENMVQLRKGSYFVDDVIGCEVVTEEQNVVGKITDLLSLPANDVWVVRKGAKEILIPAVKAIIRHVDVEQKRITIHALEGLLD